MGSVLKRSRKRVLRYSILAANVLLLAFAVIFVLRSSTSNQPLAQSVAVSSGPTDSVNPLDQLSSADIAVNVARMTNIPEATSAANQADSVNALLAISPADQTVVAKPQVVATIFKSNKDILTYITHSGDTVSKLAAKFHITSNSIRASNGITGNLLTSGQRLYIPPFNGIVYVVRSGDTPSNLAAKFNASKEQIIKFNDAEIGGLRVGTRIVIPNGQVNIAPATAAGPSSFASSFAATYGGNGYDYGFCTWYVANRVPVPTNWGNASTWAYYAPMSGWTVSNTPHVGSIAQTSYGFGGHVAYVEAVSPDGSQIKYSDMNGIAGWGSVGYSGWVPVSKFQHYISH